MYIYILSKLELLIQITQAGIFYIRMISDMRLYALTIGTKPHRRAGISAK